MTNEDNVQGLASSSNQEAGKQAAQVSAGTQGARVAVDEKQASLAGFLGRLPKKQGASVAADAKQAKEEAEFRAAKARSEANPNPTPNP